MSIINIEFISGGCNCYQRGGVECPLYAIKTYIMHSHTDNMQLHASVWWNLFIHTKFQCIERKLNFVVACVMPCFDLFHPLARLLLLFMIENNVTLVF
jgi:hypothetical protein